MFINVVHFSFEFFRFDASTTLESLKQKIVSFVVHNSDLNDDINLKQFEKNFNFFFDLSFNAFLNHDDDSNVSKMFESTSDKF